MVVFDLYSRRRRREQNEPDDVVQYSEIPQKLRQQFAYIVAEVFGDFGDYSKQNEYRFFVDRLRREFGVKALTSGYFQHPGEELEAFFLQGSDEGALDAIDFVLRLMHFTVEEGSSNASKKERHKDAIAEFNERCRLAAFGYSFEDGKMLRVDSTLLHAEAVKPALVVLSDPAFENADKEFRNAHEHWRHGKHAEVLVDCGKAFESTMKIIAAKQGWTVPDKPTASQLVKAMLDNGLIPDYYQTQMGGLRSILESGIPTPRNRSGGHGAGTASPEVPEELVRYVLHLTAATILFLVDAHKSRPRHPRSTGAV